jgi:uncharacterized phage-like protein YoqJ
MKTDICCFTGLRPQKINFGEDSKMYYLIMQKCKKYIIQLIERYGVTHFISGMALGFDTWCAEEILKLKKLFNITLECAIPCKEQDKYWNDTDKQRYRKISKTADTVNILQQYYSSNCMIKRNCYMVDKSLYIIALWDGQSGGTAYTIQYAMKCKKRIIVINPLTCKATFYG